LLTAASVNASKVKARSAIQRSRDRFPEMRLRQLLGKWAELGKFAKRSNSVVYGHHRYDLGYFGYLRCGHRHPACVCLPVAPAPGRDICAGSQREPRRRLETHLLILPVPGEFRGNALRNVHQGPAERRVLSLIANNPNPSPRVWSWVRCDPLPTQL
jgi:hypothetical protein